MGIFSKALGIDSLKMQIKALQSNISIQQFTQLSTQIYPSWQVFKDLETYRLIDDISSVVNRLADTAAKIPLYAYNKAGEDFPAHNKLSAFLASLTYYHRLEMFTFLYIFEECFIYTTVIDYGPNAGVKSMHMLHPNHVTVVVSDEFPESIIGFIYRDPQKGYEVKLLQEEVIFIRGINPTTDFYQKWRGLSRITLLSKTLTRLSANMSNSVAQMQNGGVPGILYDKQADWDIEKQSFRESKMLSFFTNPANKALPYSASGDMGFLPIGSSLVDLDSAELAKIDLKKICNAYGVSDRLFGNDGTGSEVSDDNAQKGLYVNAIEPKLKLVEDALTEKLNILFKEKAVIKFDLSDIQVLQDDLLKKAQALAAAPVMVPNDVRQAMGYDRSDDPLMDLDYIKTGYQPITDFTDIPSVE